MATAISKITVLFEDPFWIGLYERESGKHYEVCKITFGAEPKDCEVYGFLLKSWNHFRFSRTAGSAPSGEKRINPKRMQRLIRRQMQSSGVGTKAQQALNLQREQGKLERKVRSRSQKEAEQKRQYELHQEKRREKRKGH